MSMVIILRTSWAANGGNPRPNLIQWSGGIPVPSWSWRKIRQYPLQLIPCPMVLKIIVHRFSKGRAIKIYSLWYRRWNLRRWFFKADLEDLKHNNLKKSIRPAHNAGQGFIAPAVLAWSLTAIKRRGYQFQPWWKYLCKSMAIPIWCFGIEGMPGLLNAINDLVPGYFWFRQHTGFFGFLPKVLGLKTMVSKSLYWMGKTVLYFTAIRSVTLVSSPVSFQADKWQAKWSFDSY